MLQNENLSPETKQYIIDRTHTLLKDDPKAKDRLSTYERVWVTKTATTEDTLIAGAWQHFLNEKEKITVPLLFDLTAKKKAPPATDISINWTKWAGQGRGRRLPPPGEPILHRRQKLQKAETPPGQKERPHKKAIHGYGSSP